MLDEVRQALLHLVRNAVDHGLERPEARRALGKPEEGQVSLEFEQRGAQLWVTVRDDGAGVNLARVRAKALERKLVASEAAANALDTEALHAMLFEPGFSTAEEVTRTSGRGVGLDVVRDNVQRLGGEVTLHSEPGQGAAFILELPLTLSTTQGVLVESAGFTLALPLVAVPRALHVRAASGNNSDTLDVDGRLLPLRELRVTLGLPAVATRVRSSAVVLVRHGSREVALRVDKLVGERELVFKPLPPELLGLPHLTGAAPLGDGRLVFLLSPRALVEDNAANVQARLTLASRRRVLVADDSLTTRVLHRQVLEAAGFEVETAANGEEAWEALRRGVPDLVVSDVQMPRLDGLGLARRMRAESMTANVPLILVSSLDSADDARRAREAGASSYLTKQAYQRGELMRLVRLHLGGTEGNLESAG